jgi:hypothetical protein
MRPCLATLERIAAGRQSSRTARVLSEILWSAASIAALPLAFAVLEYGEHRGFSHF